MNFLAHSLLSGADPDILLGNLMADFLKVGDETLPRSIKVQRGIEWHYKIDRFMDSHPVVAQSRRRLFPNYRHYGAVLVDIFYDHLLAIRWDEFSAVPLTEFAQQVYDALEARRDQFPPRMTSVMPFLIADNWLCAYARPEGVIHALTRVQMRGTRGIDLVASWQEFEAEKSLYEAEFSGFFPQILQLQHEELGEGNH